MGEAATLDGVAGWFKKWIGLMIAIVVPIVTATWIVAASFGQVNERLKAVETKMDLLLQGLNITVETMR